MTPEIVYINNGAIYKSALEEADGGPRFVVDGVESRYRGVEPGEVDMGEMCRYVSEKTQPNGSIRIKRYRATSQLRALMGIGGGADLGPQDLCPAVALWLAKATYDDDDGFCELYFRAHQGGVLERVAEYYGLPNPATKTMVADIDRDPWGWGMQVLGIDGEKQPIVTASVVFADFVPVLFKLYKSEFCLSAKRRMDENKT